MEKFDIYKDISERTNGDIFIGVVGPVRTGKSTFIRNFMEKIVIPNISNKLQKNISIDDLPQSGDGKMVMTTQPKFVPQSAVKVQFKNKVSAKIRLVDCVGYIVDGAITSENDKERYIKTPWSDEEMPFNKASEFGTDKVINDYSSIGIAVFTDGSFGDIKRENYIKAEERVVNELKTSKKPFVIVLNSANPNASTTQKLASELESKYSVSTVCVNVKEMSAEDIGVIIEKVLMEFPINNININLPSWLNSMSENNLYIEKAVKTLKEASLNVNKMCDYVNFSDCTEELDFCDGLTLKNVNLSTGELFFDLAVKNELFYKVLSDECETEINDEYSLINYIKTFSKEKKKYEKIKSALNDAEENGYGVVLPSVSEMNLEEPQLVKQGRSFGVKLKASAPSLHIMKVDVNTEVSPTVGTEKQGEDMVKYLMNQFEDNPNNIWETNMFGKSLHDLVNEGISSKVNSMPKEAQVKMRKTVTKIVNENKGGIICILL
ncbi:MAG: stage IV sporulation protein A [Clostridia bacterium]|nr:stage IV sporulation protein A [Clostridia bacterium]